MVEKNVTLDIVYQHILAVEHRLKHNEDLLEIPVENPSAKELKEHKETLKRMKEGKEGISWEEYKEFQEIRQKMLKHGGTSLTELEKERKKKRLKTRD